MDIGGSHCSFPNETARERWELRPRIEKESVFKHI